MSCNDSVTSVTGSPRQAIYQNFRIFPTWLRSASRHSSETVGLAVDGTPMKITASAAFSAGLPEVKALEVAMAIENGADEVDIVLNIGPHVRENTTGGK